MSALGDTWISAILKVISVFRFFFFLNYCFFIVERERARDRARAGEGRRERETQNPGQVPGSELSAQSTMWGSSSRTVRS